MNKITITLKQHTPLLHFQPMQEGATLRASEVKPKFDKFLLRKLGGGDYDKGVVAARKNGWLVGDSNALNYKMKIVSSNLNKEISLNVQEATEKINNNKVLKKDPDTNEQLYTTSTYPNPQNSVIMGNVGGRLRDNLLNFVMYKENTITFASIYEGILVLIDNNIDCFINCTNFGNRTSKGFGSFQVTTTNAREMKNYYDEYYAIISATIDGDNDSNSYKEVFSIIFTLINLGWKTLKRIGKVNGKKQVGAVLLDETKLYLDNERIPSPIYVKPFIYKNNNNYDVELAIYLDKDVIKKLGIQTTFYEQKIDDLLNKINVKSIKFKGYNIHNIKKDK